MLSSVTEPPSHKFVEPVIVIAGIEVIDSTITFAMSEVGLWQLVELLTVTVMSAAVVTNISRVVSPVDHAYIEKPSGADNFTFAPTPHNAKPLLAIMIGLAGADKAVTTISEEAILLQPIALPVITL